MSSKFVAVIAFGVLVAGGYAHAGVDQALLCKEEKAEATGKKALDLLRAFGKNHKKPNATKLAFDISKAQSKFTKGFTRTQATGECLTSGESDAIEAKVDLLVCQVVDSVGSGTCGNNCAGVDEECDGTDNAACPTGVCLGDCTCAEPTTTTIVPPTTTTTQPPTTTTIVPPTTTTTQAPTTTTLPPDPSSVAPPINPTVATTMGKVTEFLYTGDDPIQTGVAPGTIEPTRVSVLRGLVLDGDALPLPGVAITVLDHSEFGQTLSRLDGQFDLAVNGGGLLTVEYEKDGYLPAQRQIDAPWQAFALLPDVALTRLADSPMTPIDLTSGVAIQVARGNVESDGEPPLLRRATLLFEQGTHATMVFPDGSTQPISALDVRATEYTVGPNGVARMPALLPPNSGYTYAVELSADQAIAAGARAVEFDQPLKFYLENFLGFSVGSAVPVGFYDRARGVWVPSDNGLTLKILSDSSGLAELDVDGSGQPADAAALAALGISEAEREELAVLYEPEQSLWRVPVPHFSPWDCNWPFEPPSDAVWPSQPPPREENPEDDFCAQAGSTIECENQTLGEAVPVVGTPYQLHYRSDRVPGRSTARTLRIPVREASVPQSLKRIEVEVSVAGETTTAVLDPVTDPPEYEFTWDGGEVYGRQVQGATPVDVRIDYVYDDFYQDPAPGRAFGRFSGVSTVPPVPARREIALSQSYQATLRPWDALGQGLGGWTVNVHHTYDPTGRKLYLGDGRRRTANAVSQVITTVAGNGSSSHSGDGGPATEAGLDYPTDVAVGPEGSLYIAEHGRVRRVDRDGIIMTVAGTGSFGYSGDNGPATSAEIGEPVSVVVASDGSFCIADIAYDVVRRVDGATGTITTVAGSVDGEVFVGEGGPATEAVIPGISSVALGPDGTLYIGHGFEGMDNGLRQVATDGLITTVVPGGWGGGDGGPARSASTFEPVGLTVGLTGDIFIGEWQNGLVRQITQDGIIDFVAGAGSSGLGDGGPATQANLGWVRDVAMDREGNLYISDSFDRRIRMVKPGGIITTFAGGGSEFPGDGGPATAAELGYEIAGVAAARDGSVYLADTGNNRVYRIAPLFSGLSAGDSIIPAENGSEIYVFTAEGRHLRTLEALSGRILYQFTYDAAGRLTTITDGSGKETQIERDVNGSPTAIEAPGGQRTTLSLDANGYIDSIDNPAGEAVTFTYTSEGLLHTMTDARHNDFVFTYDSEGRLTMEADPAEGSQTLDRTVLADGFRVDRTTGEGRLTSYLVEKLPDDSQRRVNTFPGGLAATTTIATGAMRSTLLPNGRVMQITQTPDPRFGMQAPIAGETRIGTPGGLELVRTETRTINLSDPLDPLSLTTATATVELNGRMYTRTFEAVPRTVTDISPEGRQRIRSLDANGRVLSDQRGNLEPTTISYDLGRVATITRGSGLETRTYTFSYDPQSHRLTDIDDPLGRLIGFAYDGAGRVDVLTLPGGPLGQREVNYGYDVAGNLTFLTPPDRVAHGFTYTAVNLPETYSAPDVGEGSTTTTFTHNLDAQLTEITRPPDLPPAPPTIVRTYDAATGRLLTVTTPGGQLTYSYQGDGNLATLTASYGADILTLSYEYDGILPTKTIWTEPLAGSVGRTYDDDFRITSTRVNAEAPVVRQYDDAGLLTNAGALQLSRHPEHGLVTGSALGVVTDAYTYNGFGEASSYVAMHDGQEKLRIEFPVRDQLGRVIERWETLDGQPQPDIYVYAYDDAGRLWRVTKNSEPPREYTYDANGNRETAPNLMGSAVYDDQDRLTQYGNATYSYTPNGELETKTVAGQTTSYVYDAVGNLRTVTLPSGAVIEYLIDGENRRVGKRVDGVLVQGWLYDGQLRPIAELDGSGALVARFIYGTALNVPEYMVKNGETYRIVTDHLGSPRLVLNSASGVPSPAQELEYDEFGQVILDSNPGFQPFGFAGGLYDKDTGLVRFGTRDYDAETGRWTAKDPTLFVGADPNLYGYALGDPVNFVDPFGIVRLPSEVRDDAEEDAKGDVPGSGWNDPQDAYRHCLASCDAAQEYGEGIAEFLGDLNEVKGDVFRKQQQGERAMDVHNNSCGRQRARPGADRDGCRNACLEALESGILITNYELGTSPPYALGDYLRR